MAITDKKNVTGRPWTVVGTHPDFETADRHASQYRSQSGTQVKVKKIASGFTVRTRLNETSKVSKQTSDPVIEERPTFEEPVSKKTKLKAKDRRAKQQRRGDIDDTDDE